MYLWIGPVLLNFCRSPFKFKRRKGGSWCLFFGLGSVGYWRHAVGVGCGKLP